LLDGDDSAESARAAPAQDWFRAQRKVRKLGPLELPQLSDKSDQFCELPLRLIGHPSTPFE